MSAESTIFLIDDDPSVRRSLSRTLHSAGYTVSTYASALDFLAAEQNDCPGCLVLDVDMPGLDGMELQEHLAAMKWTLPIVFITAHGSITMGVKAMKAGAVDFLPKPFGASELLKAVSAALEKDAAIRAHADELRDFRMRLERLTTRELDVFRLTVKGMLNKQIAAHLQITLRTVKAHRHSIMQKLVLKSLAEMVHIAECLDIPQDEGTE